MFEAFYLKVRRGYSQFESIDHVFDLFSHDISLRYTVSLQIVMTYTRVLENYKHLEPVLRCISDRPFAKIGMNRELMCII